ncbi:hypothetical protein PPACK8108_LOCUS16453, partial [Phakopsora pachyrhizi]
MKSFSNQNFLLLHLFIIIIIIIWPFYCYSSKFTYISLTRQKKSLLLPSVLLPITLLAICSTAT